jgi:hypothetical protein
MEGHKFQATDSAAADAAAAEYAYMYIILPNRNEHKLASRDWNSKPQIRGWQERKTVRPQEMAHQ